MAPLILNVCNLPAQKYGFTNCVFISKEDFEAIFGALSDESPEAVLSVDGWLFAVRSLKTIQRGTIGIGQMQRRTGQFVLEQPVSVTKFVTTPDMALANISIVVDSLRKPSAKGAQSFVEIDDSALSQSFLTQFKNQLFCPSQQLAMEFEQEGVKLTLQVSSIEFVAVDGQPRISTKSHDFGQLLSISNVEWTKAPGSVIRLSGSSGSKRTQNIFRGDVDFEKLGIGGLKEEFNAIFRRAFASRLFPNHLVKQMGINHVRGMLLYGPPGCGKTLIARQIAKVLNAREPKIVNGPEILDKYVGGAEEKIRELFRDAEKEQREMGDESMLHIVIFDEIDAICKSRGTIRDGTGVHDSVVNQLLSKIDGVDSINNILIIGMTNRKDLIDDALLRPGRLEVHIEIGLPDFNGRLQILGIHTSKMREHNRITEEAVSNLSRLAELTKNFSGAELEGLVKSASSYAFSRCIDIDNLGKEFDESSVVVQWSDFEHALEEIKPKFGANNDELHQYFRNGIVDYGSNFQKIRSTLTRLVEQLRTSERTPIMSVLLEGPPQSGKTALAAHEALASHFPFVRMITPDAFIGYHETTKCADIHRIFMDSYRSNVSLIVIDDIERLIEYNPIGPRFSNQVLQTLLILLKKPPPIDRKLMVIATTSLPAMVEDMQLSTVFNVSINVPLLTTPEEVGLVLSELVPISQDDIEVITNSVSSPIGIKQLLVVSQMALQGNETVTAEGFLDCLRTCGF